jgi:hypothetical protein
MFSIVKHLESANTMFSFIWWILGFYWVSAGGQALSHDAPQLYWYVCCNFDVWIRKNLSVFLSSSMLFSEMTIFFLQADNCFSGIWCFLCGLLYCFGLCDWNRCLLLPSVHYWYLVCCNWSGMICDDHGLLNTVSSFFFSVKCNG